MLLVALAITSFGLMNLASGAMRMADRRADTVAAFNMAEGGLDLALAWLAAQPAPPTSGLHPLQNFFGSTGGVIVNPFDDPSGANSRLTIRISEDSANSGTQTAQKRFVIESQAQTAGGTVQIVRALVQEQNFGKYAVFLDDTPSTAFWTNGSNVFDGPVHSNNSDGGSPASPTGPYNNILWKSNSAQPIFTYQGPNAFTVSAPSIVWWKDSIGNTVAPASENDWLRIASGGSASVHTGTPMIPLPISSTRQRDAALGGASPPSALGVLVPSSGGTAVGGLFVHGDIDEMTLSASGADQKIVVEQSDSSGTKTTTEITLKAGQNQTQIKKTVKPPSSSAVVTNATYVGVTNGVVYCDGSIGQQNPARSGGLSGEIADGRALTIATDPTQNINIDGNLTYHTARAKSGGALVPEASDANFTQNAGMLGLVSRNVQIMEKAADGSNFTDVEVDAAVVAYGTYDAQNYTTRALGHMTNMGSYIVKSRGLFSTTDASGNPVSGVPCSRFYDNRLADNPPPFFPTTGSTYDIVSWQRVTNLLP